MSDEKKIIADEAMQAIIELEESTRLEEVIKDNQIKFTIDETVYRVRKPNVIETEDISSARRKKYIELVDDDSFYFRKQWIKKYSKKGIDINQMENDIMNLQEDIKTLLLRLAQATTEDNIKLLKKEIIKLRTEQNQINVEKVDLMSHCIEDQILIYVNSFTAYLMLEKQENQNWVKHFKTYEEYMSCKNWNLLNKMYYYINVLIYEEEE